METTPFNPPKALSTAAWNMAGVFAHCFG